MTFYNDPLYRTTIIYIQQTKYKHLIGCSLRPANLPDTLLLQNFYSIINISCIVKY
jgi:hypothetical protein